MFSWTIRENRPCIAALSNLGESFIGLRFPVLLSLQPLNRLCQTLSHTIACTWPPVLPVPLFSHTSSTYDHFKSFLWAFGVLLPQAQPSRGWRTVLLMQSYLCHHPALGWDTGFPEHWWKHSPSRFSFPVVNLMCFSRWIDLPGMDAYNLRISSE